MPFPTAQHVSFPSAFPKRHNTCLSQVPFPTAQPFPKAQLAGLFFTLSLAERQTGNLRIPNIGFTRLGIKPKSVAPKVDALTTRPFELILFIVENSKFQISILCGFCNPDILACAEIYGLSVMSQ